MHKNTENFTITQVGEVSDETWTGDFEVKLVLTPRERIIMDNFRKSLLGQLAGENSDQAYSMAWSAAAASVRVVKAPDWWKQSNHGLDLLDYDIAVAVWNKISEIAENFEKERLQKVKKAKETVEKMLTAQATAEAEEDKE